MEQAKNDESDPQMMKAGSQPAVRGERLRKKDKSPEKEVTEKKFESAAETDGSDHQAGLHLGEGSATQRVDDDSRWKRKCGKLPENISDDTELPDSAEAQTWHDPKEWWQ